MSYLIAIASSDGINIDLHFGEAREYHIFSINDEEESWQNEGIRKIKFQAEAENQEKNDAVHCLGRNEEFIDYAANILSNCKYVLVSKIGPRPQKLLLQHSLSALETREAIDEAIPKIVAYEKRQRNVQ